MAILELHPTRCAICGTEGAASEIYAANFDPADFSPGVFSARRLPDGAHYRLVRCDRCQLVRSDPVIDAAVLSELYVQSAFTYGAELENIRRSYGRGIARARSLTRAGDFLEIGCGNGFMLPEALRQGFRRAVGVEPSTHAVASADPQIRPMLVQDIMRPGLFPADSFDLVCMFQVLDHFPDPMGVVRECLNVLRPGGVVLSINHNLDAISSRLLKERSPIIDIEHTFLYTPATMRKLFSAAGFRVEAVNTFWNDYNLQYLLHLVPFPARIKKGLMAIAEKTGAGRLRLRVPLGNLELIGRKPNPGEQA